MGKIIAIVNQKGNVGKTTTTTFLGKALTNQKKKVLIIDLDPLSNAIALYDTSSQEVLPLSECMEGRAALNDCIMTVENDGLSIAFGGKHLIGFEISALNQTNREQVLAASLKDVKDGYDYILIDSPSSLGLLTMNALAAADEIIIPIRCDNSIFEGMAEMLRTIDDVSNSLNPQLTIAGFLITHVNTELRSTSINLKEIHTCYGSKVLHTLITSDGDFLVNYTQLATELFA